jgi:hypothetical protein
LKYVQSNLRTTTTLGTQKIVAEVDKWSLFRDHVSNSTSNWDLKIVVFSSGLTVLFMIKCFKTKGSFFRTVDLIFVAKKKN